MKKPLDKVTKITVANDGAVGREIDPPENVRHTVNQKLDVNDYQQLKKLAEEHCVSVQYLLEQFVKYVLDRPKKEIPFLWKYRD